MHGTIRKWAAMIAPFVSSNPELGKVLESMTRKADKLEQDEAQPAEPAAPAPVTPALGDGPPCLVVRVSEEEGFVGVEAADFFRDQVTDSVIEGTKTPFTLLVPVIVAPVEGSRS